MISVSACSGSKNIMATRVTCNDLDMRASSVNKDYILISLRYLDLVGRWKVDESCKQIGRFLDR